MKIGRKKKAGIRTAVMALLFLAGVSGSATALQPLITDDTGTQGEKGNQLEVSYSRDRTRVAGGTERVHTLPLVYTYGLAEAVDVFASVGYSRIRTSTQGGDASGLGNTAIGAKWRFFENAGSSLAVKPEIAVPVSAQRENDGLGTGKISGNLTLVFSQEMPFGSVHFNAGVGRDRFRRADENPDTRYKRVSVAPVWDVTEQWKLALDLGMESAHADGHSVRSRFTEVGAIYSPSKDLDLALGLVRTTDNEQLKATTRCVTAGATLRF